MRFVLLLGLLGAFLSWDSVAKSDENTVVLDVRTTAEYSESHIKKSVNIDFLAPTFKDEISKLPRANEYLLYCRSGNRSSQAIQVMKSLGFTRLKNLGSLREAAKALEAECEGKKSQC